MAGTTSKSNLENSIDCGVNNSTFREKIAGVNKKNGVALAVGVDDNVSHQVIDDLYAHGVKIAELRIDLFNNTDPEHIKEEISKYDSFIKLATIRTEKEGGKWVKSEEERIKLFREIVPLVDAIDLELSSEETIISFAPEVRENNCGLLISYHNYENTPPKNDLREIAQKAIAMQADVVKIACITEDRKDVVNLASLFSAEDIQHPLVAIAMGAKDIMSRLAFPYLGSVFTFASLDGFSTAPGQIPFRHMDKLLRSTYSAYNENRIIDGKLMEFV